MEHMVINVEAQLARRIYDSAVELEQQADEAERLARQAIEAAAQVADPVEQAIAQREAFHDLHRVQKLRTDAAGAHIAARTAVARSKSLDRELAPHEIEPVMRVPLSDADLNERKAMAKEAARVSLRVERNGLLAASDWTQLPDVPVKTKATWARYRQQLRDLPAKTKNPAKPDWPTPPKAGGSK